MIKPSINRIKKNSLQYFILKLIGLLIIIVILDYSIGNILQYFYFKQESGLQYRTTYAIEKTTADILIFGSSRANHHYDCDTFEKKFNLSYYNVGRDGNFILYSTAVLRGILKRYTPKIVILDLSSGEFQLNQYSYDRLSSLLPYYDRHPEMHSIIELKSKLEKLKMMSSIYPYNSSILTIAIGNTEYNKSRRSDIKGFVPLSKTWNGKAQIDNEEHSYEIDSIKVKAYKSFIHDCIRSNIKLYIVCSPYLKKSNHTDCSVTLGQKIAEKNNILFFNYSSDSIFTNNPNLFFDIVHLNKTGAEYFSNILIDDIKKNSEIDSKEILANLPDE